MSLVRASSLILRPSILFTVILSCFFFAPCSIVHSFEVLVSVFARQLEVGDRISFMTENVLFVAELVSWVACNMEKPMSWTY